MSSEKTEDAEVMDLAVVQRIETKTLPAPMVRRSPNLVLKFASFSEAMEAASLFAQSQMVPQSYRGRPADIVLAWQYGAELGLMPMQALQSVAVINGRPALWGDGLLAICQAHPDWEGMDEDDLPTAKKNEKATCVVRRRGRKPCSETFSMADAEKAGLLNKKGPWQTYPARMLQMRARGFALRNAFADALRGFSSIEEMMDYPAEIRRVAVAPEPDEATGRTIEADPDSSILPRSAWDPPKEDWAARKTKAKETIQAITDDLGKEWCAATVGDMARESIEDLERIAAKLEHEAETNPPSGNEIVEFWSQAERAGYNDGDVVSDLLDLYDKNDPTKLTPAELAETTERYRAAANDVPPEDPGDWNDADPLLDADPVTHD